jgi:hypothetical protein
MIAGETICHSGKYRITIINSTFRCFSCLFHAALSFFVIFVANSRALPPPIPKVAIFLCPFSYEKIYFWIHHLSLTVLGDESCCKPHLAKTQQSIITIIITLKFLKSLSESNTTDFIILHWCDLVHGSCSSLLS